jgi:hypothetical protein
MYVYMEIGLDYACMHVPDWACLAPLLAHNLCERQATPGMTALSFRGKEDLI